MQDWNYTATQSASMKTDVQNIIVDLLNALSAIKQLSEVSFHVDEEATLIRNALASLLQNQDMERCSFFLLDDEGMLSNVAGLSLSDLRVQQASPKQSLRFKVGEGIIGIAAASHQIQTCNNCPADPRFSNSGQAQIPGSIVSAPVFTLDDHLVGVINISHPQIEFFSNWHLRLLQVYCNVLGQLITNYRMFRDMEREINRRTQQLQEVVAETERLKDHYAALSMRDQLTDLHNRRYFYEQAEFAIANHQRYHRPFCLLVLDIDHFKRINDQFGHAFGDQVLVSVANFLKNQIRTSDILVRFGGEEFVVIFSNTCCDNGKVFAERIRNDVKALTWQDHKQFTGITLSIGLHCLSDAGEHVQDIDSIVHCADTALYAAKANGRDQVVVYRDGLLP